MSELPENYEEVLRNARFNKRLSSVRWECMLEKIEAVLRGERPGGLENWTPEHAEKLKEDLANQ